MTKKDKLLNKIKHNPRNVTLEEFEALIEDYGYIKKGGKHPKARIGSSTMPYKRESPVKLCYVKELLRLINEL